MGLDRRSDRPAAERGAFEITDESGDETSFDATGEFASFTSPRPTGGGPRGLRLRSVAVAALLPLAVVAVWAIARSHEAGGPATPPSSSRQPSTRTEHTRARGHARRGHGRSPSRLAELAALPRARRGRVVRRRPSAPPQTGGATQRPQRAARVAGPSPRPTAPAAPVSRPAVAPAPASAPLRRAQASPSPAASEFGFEG